MLIENLPIELTASGRYQLACPLTSPPGDYGIKVSAPDVTLDLGGHSLKCEGEVGILVNAPRFSLFQGVLECARVAVASEPQFRAEGSRFRDLEITGDVHLPSPHCVFERCRLGGWAYGVHSGEHALVSGCEVEGGTVGIEVGPGSTVVDCKVRFCEDGVYALGVGEHPCLLQGLEVTNCRGLGVRLDGPGRVVGCRIRENGHELATGGLLAGPGAEVSDCVVVDNVGGNINVVQPTRLVNNQVT